MSATKEFLAAFEDTLQDCEVGTYQLQTALVRLSNICWHGGPAFVAPGADWLEQMESELVFAMDMLKEVRAARESLDFKEV